MLYLIEIVNKLDAILKFRKKEVTYFSKFRELVLSESETVTAVLTEFNHFPRLCGEIWNEPKLASLNSFLLAHGSFSTKSAVSFSEMTALDTMVNLVNPTLMDWMLSELAGLIYNGQNPNQIPSSLRISSLTRERLSDSAIATVFIANLYEQLFFTWYNACQGHRLLWKKNDYLYCTSEVVIFNRVILGLIHPLEEVYKELRWVNKKRYYELKETALWSKIATFDFS